MLSSAERLFRDQGFGATTIRQIASDAGVSAGTVMAVGDKDALLVAIFDGWITAVHDLREAPTTRRRLSRSAALTEALELFEPFVAYFSGDEDLAREYAAIITRGRHPSAIFQGLGERLTREVQVVLERARAPRPASGARAVYLAYLGVLMTASHGAVSTEQARAQLEDVITFVINPTGAKP